MECNAFEYFEDRQRTRSGPVTPEAQAFVGGQSVTFSGSAIGRFTRVRGMMVTVSLLLGLLSSFVASAQPRETPAVQPAPVPTPAPVPAQPPKAPSREEWRAAMSQLSLPKSGCFKATYPNAEWQQVPCAKAPLRPYQPSGNSFVGNGTDFAAQASASGTIITAHGSFDAVVGVTSENISGSPGLFSLQLNTNQFNSSLCRGAKTPATCYGWQQFLFSNTGQGPAKKSGLLFMQYWLFNYGAPCPADWQSGGGTSCVRNSNATFTPSQTIADLPRLSLTAKAVGGMDAAILETSDGELDTATGEDNVLDLQQVWQAAEFNVFGDCCFTRADFNSGTTIIVRLDVNNGGTTAPACLSTGYTGETNNLALVDPCCPIGGNSPGIVFTESSAPGTKSMCACPTGTAWNADLATCVCKNPGQIMVNGQCETPKNSCGGTDLLAGLAGESCGQKCGRLTCTGQNTLRCESFTNACGGCSALPRAPGEGPQLGESCECAGGAKGHYSCTGLDLSCDCHQ
jgi:hypothetical protein